MSSNGLRIEDVEIGDEDELSAMVDGIEMNVLTREEVQEKFVEFIRDLDANHDNQGLSFLRYLASFIFVNGAHKNIPESRKVTAGVTWGKLRDVTKFTDSNKSMRLRFCAPFMSKLAQRYPDNERNFLYRLCQKWGLMEQFRGVPVANRFFGGYYFDSGIPGGSSAMLALQKRIISLAEGGGEVANKGV